LQEITDEAVAWIAMVTAQPPKTPSLPAQANEDEQPEHDTAREDADLGQAEQRGDPGQQQV
jgi:hypothetical protein